MARDLQFACLLVNYVVENGLSPETKVVYSFVIIPKNHKDHRYTGSTMKKVIWLLAILLVGIHSVPGNAASHPSKPNRTGTNKVVPSDDAQGIQFTETSWKEILKKAKAEKKVIFLDAYASWCGPCKMLQKHVFTQKNVGDFYNSKFINVKMDMEKGEGPALSQVYPLEAYPTLLFIDANGKLLKKFIGAPKAEDLIALGKSVK